jgi:hypothetical protein
LVVEGGCDDEQVVEHEQVVELVQVQILELELLVEQQLELELLDELEQGLDEVLFEVLLVVHEVHYRLQMLEDLPHKRR